MRPADGGLLIRVAKKSQLEQVSGMPMVKRIRSFSDPRAA
jgi:hypothetical protein